MSRRHQRLADDESIRPISYLPLSHIAGQFGDIYSTIIAGVTVYFAQPDALKVCLSSHLNKALNAVA